jgi:class 3 adenylate cyclase/tetratricopeptide (TPR) repeat protein
MASIRDAPALREERKVVTALFADLVGSTSVGERFDPEDAREIISGAIALMIEAVERYGGTVKDLAGDGVLALFGAPVSHEDDVERAILAGLDITNAIEGYAAQVARDWGHEGLGARVGIDTGLAVLGPVGAGRRVEYGAVGDVVNTAARLQSAARPGAVLVGGAAREEAVDRFDWETSTALSLKGKEAPVTASVALRPTGAPARAGTGGRVEPAFVGRAAELAAIDGALAELATGDGSAVFVIGEPGIGKSRLVSEGRRRALSGRYGSPIVWLEGRCLSYTDNVPYGLFRDLLSGSLGIASGGGATWSMPALEGDAGAGAAIEPADTPYLELLLTEGGAADAGEGEDAEGTRERVFAAAESTFLRLAAGRPTVVSLEDLHWADPTSLALTERLLRAVVRGPLLVLVTARPERSHGSDDMIRSAVDHLRHRARRIELAPLSEGEDRELFASLPGAGAVPDPLRRAILGTTEGNPFFLGEQVRSLAETGRLVVDPRGRWRYQGDTGVDIPRTVERVLLARIDRLGSEEKDVLTAASVLGREFRPDILPRLFVDATDVEMILSALQRIDLVVAEEHGAGLRYRFRHALIQEAAYRSLLKRRRKELHGRAAVAMESASQGATETIASALGHHLEQAGEVERAVPHLMTAGDRARDSFANEEALSWYGRALAALGEVSRTSDPDRWNRVEADLHARRGQILGIGGRYEEARDAYRRSIELLPPGDPVRSARIRTDAAWIEISDHRYPEALAALDLAEDALGDLGDADSSDPERLSAWLDIQDGRMAVFYWLDDLQKYADLIEEVRPIVETRGTPRQRAGLFETLLTYALRRDRYVVSEETLGYAKAHLSATEQIVDASATAVGWARFNLGFTLLWADLLDEASEHLDVSAREGDRTGDITLLSRSRTYRMVVDRRRGDPSAVERTIEPVIAAAREASLPEYEAMAIANRSWAHARHGRMAEAESDALAALELWRGLQIRYPFEWMAIWPLIEIELGRARIAEAIAWAKDMLAEHQQPLPPDLRSCVERAMEAWEAGDRDGAERELRGALPVARDLNVL